MRDSTPLALAAADFRGGAARSATRVWPPLLWGACVGAAAVFLPILGFLARALSVFVHEVLGHSAAYWFTARPSIPAPNFFGETGHALHFGFSWVAYFLWLAAWVWAWAFSPVSGNPFVKVGVPLAAAIQAVLLFAGGTEFFGTAAGHGSEIFWAFALAVWAAGRRHATPVTPFVAAVLSAALAAGVAVMCAQILWSPAYREFYLLGRQDLGTANDLARLAGESGLSAVAGWYLAAALVAVPGGFALGKMVRKTLGDA